MEHIDAIQLCPEALPSGGVTLLLPSKTCKFSFILMAKAYGAVGLAVSALHTMALLQVYKAKALKELHKGSSDRGMMQEPCIAHSLGQTMAIS